MKNIKNIIVVSSGKGGVGKSTVSVNLAISLSKKKLDVGLLDADIFGPSIPKMLGITEKPSLNKEKKILPFEKYGIRSMSIGNLIDDDKPVIWRGAMVIRALNQMLSNIDWGKLDYLIIDLPPGTGDVQLTLSQSLKLKGAIIVSTPQEISLIDVRRAINMFKRVNVKILGFIENMSYFVVNKKKNYIFGKEGVIEESKKQNITFLGQIPIIPEISSQSDLGKPIILLEKDGLVARKAYEDLTKLLIKKLDNFEQTSNTKITFE